MTQQCVCAVRDLAVGAFLRPFNAPSIGWALRSFTDEVNRKAEDNSMYQHPEDYELHLLAMFEDTTGSFLPPEGGVRTLVRAKDVIKEA